MVQREQETSNRSTLKQRREQVLERLAAVGLGRGPRRIVRDARISEGDTSLGLKLRLVLGDLGPIFSSFGSYLATRVDLLPAADCLELECIANDSPRMPLTDVRSLFERETGYALEKIFLTFENQPFEARLLHQLHHACLQNGMLVVVKLVRPDAASRFLCDLELLELIEPVIPVRGAVYKGAVADFVTALRQQIDLTHEANALEMLRRDAEEVEMLRVPEVVRDLCTPAMLITERIASMSREKVGSLDQQGVARLLCSTWLRQALTGHIFPVEPCPANVAIISDRQIVFTGGAFSSLPGEAQSNLWKYLIASASDNPDQACSFLQRELGADGRRGGDEDLRHRFRQVVPFRDSGWYSDGSINYLIEHLVVHWQAAIECGYVPQSHLPPFYRGLFAITRMAQRLARGTDPLLEGLQEARLLESVARMREMFSFQRLGDHFDKYTGLLMGMPQGIDQALTLGSEGSARVKVHVSETASHQRQKNSTAAVTAMLLLLAAVAFALPRVTSLFVGNDWAGRINAVAFVACAALLLLVVSRTR